MAAMPGYMGTLGGVWMVQRCMEYQIREKAQRAVAACLQSVPVPPSLPDAVTPEAAGDELKKT